MSTKPADYSLYVHIPWCIKKCPYCDFNSHEKRDDYNEDGYIDALIRDLDRQAIKVKGRRLSSVFIGGGTPSLFSVNAIDRLLSAIKQRLQRGENLEITMEANPGTAEAEKFKGFYEIGVNRLSIGVQSFNDTHLQLLGRVHNAKQAHGAIRMAQDAGFKRINIDLMFGLPQQSLEQALLDVELALSYQTGHLSHYQLTLEKNTLFYNHPPELPHDELIWDMQTNCQQTIANQLQQYEVSAYAAEQQRSRHNLNYWQFGDYLGIGAGAHGKLTNQHGQISRYWNKKQPREYMTLAGTASCLGGNAAIPAPELPFEFMINALRLTAGFTLQQYQQRTYLDPSSVLPKINQLIGKGLLQQDANAYRCTKLGWNFLNDTLEHFLPT
jgi:putative oxygen-independent coproporphyrinogen III oxidase|tara:strand:- start:27631 stop:28779 length:1149 start_codon:yes stop_codon:yes gene_type:complete